MTLVQTSLAKFPATDLPCHFPYTVRLKPAQVFSLTVFPAKAKCHRGSRGNHISCSSLTEKLSHVCSLDVAQQSLLCMFPRSTKVYIHTYGRRTCRRMNDVLKEAIKFMPDTQAYYTGQSVGGDNECFNLRCRKISI